MHLFIYLISIQQIHQSPNQSRFTLVCMRRVTIAWKSDVVDWVAGVTIAWKDDIVDWVAGVTIAWKSDVVDWVAVAGVTVAWKNVSFFFGKHYKRKQANTNKRNEHVNAMRLAGRSAGWVSGLLAGLSFRLVGLSFWLAGWYSWHEVSGHWFLWKWMKILSSRNWFFCVPLEIIKKHVFSWFFMFFHVFSCFFMFFHVFSCFFMFFHVFSCFFNVFHVFSCFFMFFHVFFMKIKDFFMKITWFY